MIVTEQNLKGRWGSGFDQEVLPAGILALPLDTAIAPFWRDSYGHTAPAWPPKSNVIISTGLHFYLTSELTLVWVDSSRPGARIRAEKETEAIILESVGFIFYVMPLYLCPRAKLFF